MSKESLRWLCLSLFVAALLVGCGPAPSSIAPTVPAPSSSAMVVTFKRSDICSSATERPAHRWSTPMGWDLRFMLSSSPTQRYWVYEDRTGFIACPFKASCASNTCDEACVDPRGCDPLSKVAPGFVP